LAQITKRKLYSVKFNAAAIGRLGDHCDGQSQMPHWHRLATLANNPLSIPPTLKLTPHCH